MAILRERCDCRLLILGDGEDRPQLENLVKELRLTEIVNLPGFVENPYAFWRRCSLFVLSSAWEALPTVLIEALLRWRLQWYRRIVLAVRPRFFTEDSTVGLFPSATLSRLLGPWKHP